MDSGQLLNVAEIWYIDVAERTLDGAELLVDEKMLEKLNSR